MSDNNGICSLPRPPSFRGVFTQARWLKWESTEAAINPVLSFSKSQYRSLNAMISVGQTKVLKSKEIDDVMGNFLEYYQIKTASAPLNLAKPLRKFNPNMQKLQAFKLVLDFLVNGERVIPCQRSKHMFCILMKFGTVAHLNKINQAKSFRKTPNYLQSYDH